MLVWVQGSLCHIAKPGGHKINYTGVKFKSSFNVVKNHTNSACYNDSEKKYSLTYLRRTVS